MGLWSDLPSDLVEAIDAQLVFYIDKVRVRATCVSWNSFLPKMPNHKLPQLPWLLQTFVNNNKEASSHALYNLSEKKFYQLDLPEAKGGRTYRGSSHGWVVMFAVEEDDTPSSPDICLINPLSRLQIQLPPRYTFPDVKDYCADRVGEEYCVIYGDRVEYYDSNSMHLLNMGKVVTLSIPSSEDCVVCAIYGELRRLAWCTCNGKKWTPLDIYMGSDFTRPLDDLILYKNKLHVVNSDGHVFEVENIGPNPKVTLVAPALEDVMIHMYLVESCDGSLTLVGRYNNYDMNTCRFKVYKLDSVNSRWVAVKNIGNDMIFLGVNLSFSLSSCDFPAYKGNRIYFANDDPGVMEFDKDNRGDSDVVVFNLEDRSVVPLSGFINVPSSLCPLPVWVTPPSYH